VRVLIVTKDIGSGFNAHYPVAELFRARNHKVTVVAEGGSMDFWTKAGYEIYGGMPEQGQFDPNTKIRFDIDPAKVLDEIKPNVVITELADPIHLGESFGIEANKRDISLVFIEDLWGVHKRSKAVPNLVCTVDTIGDKKVKEYYQQGIRIEDVYVAITGNPAMDSVLNEKPHPELQKIVNDGKRLHVLFGQDDSTTPTLKGLVDALGKDDVFIARFHPKWLSDPSKSEHVNQWHALLKEAKEKGIEVAEQPKGVNARQLMMAAYSSVSMWSTTLTEAALLSLSVCWMSPVCKERMKAGLGFERYPLVDIGCVAEVSSPEEYLRVLEDRNTFIENCRRELKPDSKNAERVAEAIKDLILVWW